MNPALLVILAAAAVVVVGVAVVLRDVISGRRRLRTELDEARADVDALRARVEAMDTSPEPASPAVDRQDYLITSLPGDSAPRTGLSVPEQEPPASTLSVGQFTSVALGESLVRVLSFGYGVRRALSPKNRNRIRFEMGREVKRARRQRRRDLKEAKRQLRGQRTDLAEEDAA
jgi:hypothetical protein